METRKIMHRAVSGLVVIAGLIMGLSITGHWPTKMEATEDNSPKFSVESKCADAPFSVEIDALQGYDIYYTVNGDVPDVSDTKYTGAIQINNRDAEQNVIASAENMEKVQDSRGLAYVPTSSEVPKATVIRAVAVDRSDATKVSKVVTKTYFVGKNFAKEYKGAAVLSVVTDNANLFDDENGIYCRGNVWEENLAENNQLIQMGQFWNLIGNYTQKKWERPCHIDLFENDGRLGTSAESGMRIHGGASRMYAQKSLNFYMKSAYGEKTLQYRLFPGEKNYDGTKEISAYKKFMIRNGGNDTEYTKLQDVFTQNLVRNRNFTTQAARPCVVFLNGEYWGVYNLQEKYDDAYLETEFGVDKNNVIVVKCEELDEGQEGDISYYKALQGLGDLTMTDAENYKKFTDAVDIDSFLDYYATEIYIGNYDWPHNNTQLWRTRTKDAKNPYADTKWRWQLYDTEYAMGLYGDSTGDPIEWTKEKDALFYAVSENAEFKQRFTNTMCDLMNVNFRAQPAIVKLDDMASIYQPLVEQYYERYGIGWYSFYSEIDRIKSFLKGRNTMIVSSLKEHMDTGENHLITVQSDVAKQITINSAEAKLVGGEWAGTYFENYPVKITAPKVEGYDFAGWTGENLSIENASAQSTYFTPQNRTVLKAEYRKKDTAQTVQSPQTTMTLEQDSKAKIVVPKAKIKSVKSLRKKRLTVKWGKVKGAKGYQLHISLKKNFKKKKSKNLSGGKTSATIKKLKIGKKYYVRIRAYKKDANGKKVYGKWSKVKSRKIK